jgi:hypothetical protein
MTFRLSLKPMTGQRFSWTYPPSLFRFSFLAESELEAGKSRLSRDFPAGRCLNFFLSYDCLTISEGGQASDGGLLLANGEEGRNCQGTRAGRKNIDKSFIKRQDRYNLIQEVGKKIHGGRIGRGKKGPRGHR